MEVVFSPELQERLAQVSRDSGRTEQDLVEDALSAYLAELMDVREMLDSRYDEVMSGSVEMIPGEDVERYFREKSLAARQGLLD